MKVEEPIECCGEARGRHCFGPSPCASNTQGEAKSFQRAERPMHKYNTQDLKYSTKAPEYQIELKNSFGKPHRRDSRKSLREDQRCLGEHMHRNTWKENMVTKNGSDQTHGPSLRTEKNANNSSISAKIPMKR